MAKFVQVQANGKDGAQWVNVDNIVNVNLVRIASGDVHVSFKMVNGEILGASKQEIGKKILQDLGIPELPTE